MAGDPLTLEKRFNFDVRPALKMIILNYPTNAGGVRKWGHATRAGSHGEVKTEIQTIL